MKRVKGLIVLVSLFVLSFCIVSCPLDSGDGLPSGSTLEVYKDGNLVNNKSLDIDITSEGNTTIMFSAFYTNENGERIEDKWGGWSFECDRDIELKEWGDSRWNVYIFIGDIEYCGAYKITCHSLVSSEYDKTYLINIITPSITLNGNFNIKEKYKESGRVSEEEGEIFCDRFKNDITLIRGAEYDITISDKGGIDIRGIKVYSADRNIVFFRATDKNTTILSVIGNEGDECYIEITQGYTNNRLRISIHLIDKGLVDYDDYIKEEKSEKVITLSDGEKKKYRVNYSAIIDEKLMFSVNAEDIEQGRFYEDTSSQEYIPSNNDFALWYQMGTLNYSYNNERLWSVFVDNEENSFEITTYKSTTFEHTFRGGKKETKNLHTYLYVKTLSDKKWRFKVRVMVNGIAEGIKLYVAPLSSSPEGEWKELGSELIIGAGDITGWTIKAKFIPSTINGSELYWYVGKDKGDIQVSNGSKELLVPIPCTDELGFNQLHITSERKVNGYSFSSMGGLTGGGEYLIPKVSEIDDTESGIQDLFVSYGFLGTNVRLVCINTSNMLSANCLFKAGIGEGVEFKGVGLRSAKWNGEDEESLYRESNDWFDTSIKKKISVLNGINGGLVSYETPYSEGNDSMVQEYPYTIDPEYYITPKRRKMYMFVNGDMEVNFICNFKIEEFECKLSMSASKVIGVASTSIDKSGKVGELSLSSVWANMQSEDKGAKYYSHTRYLTTGEGVPIYIHIKSESGQGLDVVIMVVIAYKNESD